MIVACMYEYNKLDKPMNTLVTDTCIEYGFIDLTADDKDKADYIFAILSKTKTQFNFQLLVSAIVV